MSVPKTKKLKPYEKYLKKFKYKKALCAAFEVSVCNYVLVLTS